MKANCQTDNLLQVVYFDVNKLKDIQQFIIRENEVACKSGSWIITMENAPRNYQ